MEVRTVAILLEVEVEKDIRELANKIAQRAYVIEGVRDVREVYCRVVEDYRPHGEAND